MTHFQFKLINYWLHWVVDRKFDVATRQRLATLGAQPGRASLCRTQNGQNATPKRRVAVMSIMPLAEGALEAQNIYANASSDALHIVQVDNACSRGSSGRSEHVRKCVK